jgi:hypothetical protein
LWVASLSLFVQETKAMKKVIALMLLVAAMGLTGCKGEKKTPAPPSDTSGDTKPAETPAEPAK